MKRLGAFLGITVASVFVVAIILLGAQIVRTILTPDPVPPAHPLASHQSTGQADTNPDGDNPSGDDADANPDANNPDNAGGNPGDPNSANNSGDANNPDNPDNQANPDANNQDNPDNADGNPGDANSANNPANPGAANPKPVTITLATTGDTLVHRPVIVSAQAAAPKGDYNFVALMAPMLEFLANADVTICNLETPVGNPGTRLSGFPTFLGPPEVIRDLQRVGVDACSLANNHSMDQGFTGLTTTIEQARAHGLGFSGVGRTAEEAKQDAWITVHKDGRDIHIVHISATYGTNGMPVPKSKPWAVQLLHPEEIIAKAQTARDHGANIILVSLHDGVEYRTDPTPSQVHMAKALADSKVVDLVIGNHTHVPMSAKRYDGGPDGQGMWAIYGHGNLFSNQDYRCCGRMTTAGLIYTTTFEVPAQGPAHVATLEWTPFANDRAARHRLFLLDGPGSLADAHRPPGARVPAGEVAWLNAQLNTLLEGIPKRVTPLPPAQSTITSIDHR